MSISTRMHPTPLDGARFRIMRSGQILGSIWTSIIFVPITAQLGFRVITLNPVKCFFLRFRIEQYGITYSPKALRVIVCGCPFPGNLVLEVRRPKNRIQKNFQVMAGRRVAVQVQAAVGLQDAVQFHQAGRHHHQVGHNGVAADELAECGNHVLGRRRHRRVLDDVNFEGALGFLGPLPSVGEGPDLRRRLLSRPLAEQHVVGGVGVEGRVQVHQVHRLGGDVVPQHLKVVAVVEGVRGRRPQSLLLGQPEAICGFHAKPNV